jgi:hypothetical protein
VALCVFLWAKNMEHPPYSPDLAPSDFHLFGPLKHHISGERFPDDDAVERAVRAWFQQQPKVFQGLVKRWDKCLNLCEDYVKKINVVCMSLSPFDSFQSRFVTYLLNCPRIIRIYHHVRSYECQVKVSCLRVRYCREICQSSNERYLCTKKIINP